MTTTPNPTAESVIARAMSRNNAVYSTHDMQVGAVARALRAHNLLSEGAPSEEQTETAARAFSLTHRGADIRFEIRDGGSYQEVYSDGSSGPRVPAPQEPELEGWDRLGTESPAELQSWLDKMHRNESSDREKLIAEATEFIDSWDRLGSWTPDSPIGMVMRLRDALAASLDPEKVAEVIDREFDDYRPMYPADGSRCIDSNAARALCEAAKRGELS